MSAMSGNLLPWLIEHGIDSAIGLYCVAVGSGWIGKKSGVDPKYDAWFRAWGPKMKVLGWILIAISAIRALISLSTGS